MIRLVFEFMLKEKKKLQSSKNCWDWN